MSWLSRLLHPQRGYQAAQNALNQSFSQAQNLFNQAQGFGERAQAIQQPFVSQGQQAYSGLSDAMKALLDPQALQSKWTSSYVESPFARQEEAFAKERGLEAASSLGLMGSTPALQAIQAGTTNIVNQDRDKFLSDLMQKYLSGVEVGRGIYGTGANAANTQSQSLANMGQNAMNFGQNALNFGQNSAQLAYGAQNAPGAMLSSLLGAGLGILGGPLAAGFSQKMGWSPAGSYQPWMTGVR